MNNIYANFLKQLIHLEVDLDEASEQLKYFGFDCAVDLVTLEKVHLINVLELYIDDQLSNEYIDRWANLLEMNESIKICDDVVKEILYELANPYLTEPLSKKRAKTLIDLATTEHSK